jgi:hypothetical protein
MNTDELARTTFVLRRDTHEQLNTISRRMGVSRSELVRDVLREPVALMSKWVESLPEDAGPGDVTRLQGEMQLDLVEFIGRHADDLDQLGGSEFPRPFTPEELKRQRGGSDE